MRALLLNNYGSKLVLENIPVPKPSGNQILLKVIASPINPADLGFIKGHYGI